MAVSNLGLRLSNGNWGCFSRMTLAPGRLTRLRNEMEKHPGRADHSQCDVRGPGQPALGPWTCPFPKTDENP